MTWWRIRLLLVGTLLLGGCSGISPTQLGQAAGTIAGAAIIPGVGAPIGTLVGTLAGLLIESQVDKVREKHERVELGKQLGGAPQVPPTTPPTAVGVGAQPLGEPTRVWVDEHVEEGRLLAGHFTLRTIP
ncbi:MAG: hypothetical protein HYY91_03630 [Candidatus Omnitrophica bacterium]|nr:hypothetical protein [Candidatus Omnitrophota bacterium]